MDTLNHCLNAMMHRLLDLMLFRQDSACVFTHFQSGKSTSLIHAYTKLLCYAILVCVCVYICIDGCVRAYLCPSFVTFWEVQKLGPGHVPVAVVYLEGWFQQHPHLALSVLSPLCVCVCVCARTQDRINFKGELFGISILDRFIPHYAWIKFEDMKLMG